MNLGVIGTGYVGLIQGLCLAELGNYVVCVDNDEAKIKSLELGVPPIHEPMLDELLKKNISCGRIKFSTDVRKHIKDLDVIFIAVGTPSDHDGRADLTYVFNAATEISLHMHNDQVVVVKSTVPIGTCKLIEKRIKQKFQGNFEVVSNPEFLREGSAIYDFMNPDRVVIGGTNEFRGVEKIANLYKPLQTTILLTNYETSETIKYASNSYLATQISFINTISRLCEKTGADITKVAEGMKLDKRIGAKAQLRAGIGYGGSCFPKDVKALVNIANDNGVRFGILEEVVKANIIQREFFVDKIKRNLGELDGLTIAVWGLSFKPGTDDMRDAPSIYIIKSLLNEKATIITYDPAVSAEILKIIPHVQIAESPLEACKGADALLVLTEWDEFSKVKWADIAKKMRNKIIFDGRNMLDSKVLEKRGFKYHSLGRTGIQ